MPLKSPTTYLQSRMMNRFAKYTKRSESAMPDFSKPCKDDCFDPVDSYRAAEEQYFIQLAEDKFDSPASPTGVHQTRTGFHKRQTSLLKKKKNVSTPQRRAKTHLVKPSMPKQDDSMDSDEMLLSYDRNSTSSGSTTESEASVELKKNSLNISPQNKPLTFKELKRRLSFRVRKFSTHDAKQEEAIEIGQVTQPSSSQSEHFRSFQRTMSVLVKSLNHSRPAVQKPEQKTEQKSSTVVTSDDEQLQEQGSKITVAEVENKELLDKLGHLEMTMFESESLQERVRSLEHALDVVREEANDVRDYALSLMDE